MRRLFVLHSSCSFRPRGPEVSLVEEVSTTSFVNLFSTCTRNAVYWLPVSMTLAKYCIDHNWPVPMTPVIAGVIGTGDVHLDTELI
jgi:hypothetical protein